MRAKQFLPEAPIGTSPKRPARAGSRPERGHETQARYKNGISADKETQFHAKLDKLVHNTFGKRDDEMNEISDEARNKYVARASDDYGSSNFAARASKSHPGLEKYSQEQEARAKKRAAGLSRALSDKRTGKVDEIAGAFPSPSTRAKWAADAAASNAAEAKRQEMLKAQQLQKNTAEVEKQQKINHHSLDGVAVTPPTNEGPDERSQNALWAQITAHEKAAKKAKDLKQQHHLKMADQLRSKLKTSDNEVNEVAMRMQGSSAEEKAANAAAKQREAEEKAKHLAIVQAYVKIMAAGQPLPPKMQQSYNTMPDFRKEVDAALANIPGQPGRIDLEQRKNYHLIPKNESKMNKKQEAPKPRNFVAKNAIQSGAGAHKDKKKADKQGDVKHKGKMLDLAEMEDMLERASRQLCKSSKPDEDLGASNLASCKSQGYRARDGEKSHLIGHGNSKVRITVGGKKIKGKKYGGPLPDYGTRKGQ